MTKSLEDFSRKADIVWFPLEDHNYGRYDDYKKAEGVAGRQARKLLSRERCSLLGQRSEGLWTSLKIEPQDGGSEAESATHQASVSPPPAAWSTLVDISYSPVASPLFPVVWRRGALFSIEASPLFPSETELEHQGLWLWLLGGVKSAAVQTKEGRRQPQQGQLSGIAALPFSLFVCLL